MAFHCHLSDVYTIEITTANSARFLNLCQNNHVLLNNVEYLSELTLRMDIRDEEYRVLQIIAEHEGSSIQIIERRGGKLLLQRAFRHPLLIIFSILTLLIGSFLQTRILFISVDGNEKIPDKQILVFAEYCGIQFLTPRKEIRSEIIKNHMLALLPDLEWVGINTNGCHAIISVKEKSTGYIASDKAEPNNIVASRDGIIDSYTVWKGNVLCHEGQAVTKGQLLVSGYHDLGIVTKVTGADAEIYARTFRDLYIISPQVTRQITYTGDTKTKIRLLVGKNIMNFQKDSGILDTTCGKIYSEEYVQLPGGFRLPFAIIQETTYYTKPKDAFLEKDDRLDWILDFSRDYLCSQMISGTILSEKTNLTVNNGISLKGQYHCVELISQKKYEVSLPKDD